MPPEEAAEAAADLLHDDYAYVFEALWDLWMPPEAGVQGEWVLRPSVVRFIAHGPEFEESAYPSRKARSRLISVSTHPSCKKAWSWNEMTEAGVRANVQKLVEFTVKVEKNTDASGRLLWSDSGENLAQKLIARLQKVQ